MKVQSSKHPSHLNYPGPSTEENPSARSAVMSDPLTDSHSTFPDSENYDANHSSNPDSSPSPPHSPSHGNKPQMILYQPPTLWSILRGAGINLLLPFVNGLMLGFGELFAHEAAFRLGWANTKIFPLHRSSGGGVGEGASRTIGPGVVMKDDRVERRRRSGEELDMYTALE
ncbi:hypothetical protein LTR62_008465 [Meristemomyces frigidus]|uniref:TOM13-domain-containing protein n=1 Tax=Meristemomyces frigidus TaxID=1508187 RepID=A0AAN7TLP8_9PEZI|nr:hypothetical protein LTR62_008465 [Meristemomyces frigidus]